MDKKTDRKLIKNSVYLLKKIEKNNGYNKLKIKFYFLTFLKILLKKKYIVKVICVTNDFNEEKGY